MTEESIMSQDKYPSIFSPHMATIVFIILQISLAMRAIFIIREYINSSSHLGRKYDGYLSADIVCSEKRTVSYEEQIMSQDKYLSIFSPQMEAIAFIIL